MDTKVIAMVGAVIVVGAAVYGVATGTVLPGTEDISEDGGDNNANTDNTQNLNDAENSNDNENNDSDSGDQNDVGDGGTSEGESGEDSDGEASNESEVETVEDTESGEREETIPYVCEDRESDLSAEDLQNRRIAIGPPFDPLLFESMLHDRINRLREDRSDADPLNCDPELREIAREHSELVVKRQDEEYEKEVEINSTDVRYDGVCENPREKQGTWYYQRDMELNPPKGSSDQRVVLIEDHEDMVRDVRGKWAGDGNFITDITDSRMTRQGIGAYINRDTRKVIITQVLCGDGSTEESEDNEGSE